MTFVHAHIVWFIVAATTTAVGAGVGTAVLLGLRKSTKGRRRRARR